MEVELVEGGRFDVRTTGPADGPRDLAGWHTLLELLGHALDGVPVPWRKVRSEELRDRYEARTP